MFYNTHSRTLSSSRLCAAHLYAAGTRRLAKEYRFSEFMPPRTPQAFFALTLLACAHTCLVRTLRAFSRLLFVFGYGVRHLRVFNKAESAGRYQIVFAGALRAGSPYSLYWQELFLD